MIHLFSIILRFRTHTRNQPEWQSQLTTLIDHLKYCFKLKAFPVTRTLRIIKDFQDFSLQHYRELDREDFLELSYILLDVTWMTYLFRELLIRQNVELKTATGAPIVLKELTYFAEFKDLGLLRSIHLNVGLRMYRKYPIQDLSQKMLSYLTKPFEKDQYEKYNSFYDLMCKNVTEEAYCMGMPLLRALPAHQRPTDHYAVNAYILQQMNTLPHFMAQVYRITLRPLANMTRRSAHLLGPMAYDIFHASQQSGKPLMVSCYDDTVRWGNGFQCQFIDGGLDFFNMDEGAYRFPHPDDLMNYLQEKYYGNPDQKGNRRPFASYSLYEIAEGDENNYTDTNDYSLNFKIFIFIICMMVIGWLFSRKNNLEWQDAAVMTFTYQFLVKAISLLTKYALDTKPLKKIKRVVTTPQSFLSKMDIKNLTDEFKPEEKKESASSFIFQERTLAPRLHWIPDNNIMLKMRIKHHASEGIFYVTKTALQCTLIYSLQNAPFRYFFIPLAEILIQGKLNPIIWHKIRVILQDVPRRSGLVEDEKKTDLKVSTTPRLAGEGYITRIGQFRLPRATNTATTLEPTPEQGPQS